MRRLLFIEFLPGAMRRNEKSLLFPFLQGLARSQGCASLWLRFGGDLAQSARSDRGRTIFAAPSAADLRALDSHLRRSAPTHIICSELLSPAAQALLKRRSPKARFLVMPMLVEAARGTAAGSEMARHCAALGAAGKDPERFARCGWFLDWLGLRAPSLERLRLIGGAQPDYAAVLANSAARRAARASGFFISIVSGGLCGNLRRVRGNPHFAGLDLSGLEDHRGCSFCRTAGTPSYLPPGADPLPIISRQLKRVLESSGAWPGRRVFEFLDFRALRRCDEVFAEVLRLKLPPSIFLFNPRIDEVLAARKRINRILPALARAGHVMRILSMGIENFSPRENSRLNKGISPAQVDEFLALARGWERRFPRVFQPFKGGSEKIELGFILFTPWTTPADLRLNLAAARRRGFAGRGFWLYSPLLIRAGVPIHALARRDGLLTASFPDRGIAYGMVQQEADLKAVVPWRFQDRKVADFYALIVRLCAAAREGARCEFFRGEPEFAEVCRLFFSARRRGLTPLDLAEPLLEAVVAAQAPYSRLELLREVIAAAAPANRRRAPKRRTEPELSAEARAVARLVGMLRRAKPAEFKDTEFGPVREVVEPGLRCIRLELAVTGQHLTVDLMPPDSGEPCFLKTPRFRFVPHRTGRPLTSTDQRRLTVLARLLDRALQKVQLTPQA